MSKQKQLIPQLRFPEFKNESEWEELKFDKLCKFIRGPFGGALKKEIFVQDGYAVFEQFHAIYNDFSSFRYFITDEKFNELKRFSVQPFDIIMSCSGTMGKFAIVPKDTKKGIINQALLKLTVKEGYDINFVKDILELPANQNKLLSQSAGGAIKNVVEVAQIKEITLSVPNFKEQQKIASCLSSLDEVITAHSQKLELLKEHKKGLMQNLFPQEGEKVPKVRFKEFKKDGEWKENTLGQVAQNVMYGMNAAAVKFDGHSKYIRITDIDENSRLFVPSPLTSPSGIMEEKYIVNVNDLLFARTGASVGKSYLHKEDEGITYFAGFLIRFSIKNEIPYFIYAQTLTEKYQKWVAKTSMRSGQPGINAEEYKSFPIFLPPTVKEQRKIASSLSALDELITAQANKIEQLKLHKKGLMQGLFPKID